MKKLMLLVTAIGLGLLLAAPSFAFGPYYYDRLNLTDEQKTKIEKLDLAHQKEVRLIREKLEDKNVELRRLWSQPDPDKKKIEAKQKEARALRDQLEDKQTAFRLEVNKVLTAEQKEKMAAYGFGKRSGFGPRGGMRGPGMRY